MHPRNSTIHSLRGWPRTAALALLGVVLSGCASTMSSRVTTFQQWPADATGASYAFDRTPAQQDSLEHREYEEEARAAITQTGLSEARAGQPVRFGVSLDYGVTPTSVATQRPVADPFPVAPRVVPVVGRDGRVYYRWIQPYPFQSTYWETTTVPAYRHQLKVEIRDRANGNAKVYESTAAHLSASDNLPQIMPWLLRAIFDNFPDANGQVREVKYQVE